MMIKAEFEFPKNAQELYNILKAVEKIFTLVDLEKVKIELQDDKFLLFTYEEI